MSASMASCHNRGFRQEPADGVKIPRKRGPRRKDHSAVLAMVRDGATLAEIGKSAGISGERVRQIATREGVVSFHSHANERARRVQFADAVRAGTDPKEAARSLGYADGTVRNLAAMVGIARRKREAFELESAAALEAIRNGASIRSQSRDRSHEHNLGRLCNRLGIVSTAPGGGGTGSAARRVRLAEYEARR